MSGTSARIGMHCSTTAYGKRDRSTHGACDMTTAHEMPRTIAIARPVIATWVLLRRAVRRSCRRVGSVIAVRTLCGYGTKYGSPRAAYTAETAYQIPIRRRNAATGRDNETSRRRLTLRVRTARRGVTVTSWATVVISCGPP